MMIDGDGDDDDDDNDDDDDDADDVDDNDDDVCDGHDVFFVACTTKHDEHACVYIFRVSETSEPKQNASRCKLTCATFVPRVTSQRFPSLASDFPFLL